MQPIGPMPIMTTVLPSDMPDQFQAVDGAGQRLGQGGRVEARLGKGVTGPSSSTSARQFHVLGERRRESGSRRRS